MKMSNLIRFDEFEVKPSHVDIKKGIRLPTEYSDDLAYFCGILAGDGHIELNLDKQRYGIHCSGNPLDEKPLYFDVLLPLLKKLFNLEVKVKDFHSGTFGFEFGSKWIATYLTQILGLPSNNKYNQLKIPFWIKENQPFLKSYIRGLADTDFCLTLKKRYKSLPYYPVITGASKSRAYMEEIASALELLGLKVSRSFDIVQKDIRFKRGFSIIHRIHIYGPTQLISWMKMIGFASPKHLNKFQLWQARNVNSDRLKVKIALVAATKLEN